MTPTKKKTFMEKVTDIRMLWLFAGTFFIGSGSFIGVAIANGKKVVGYLAEDTITESIQESEKKTEVMVDQKMNMYMNKIENNQRELYSLFIVAFPELNIAAKKKVEERKASQMLQQAIEGQ